MHLRCDQCGSDDSAMAMQSCLKVGVSMPRGSPQTWIALAFALRFPPQGGIGGGKRGPLRPQAANGTPSAPTQGPAPTGLLSWVQKPFSASLGVAAAAGDSTGLTVTKLVVH